MLRKKFTWRVLPVAAAISVAGILMSSSHREAPLISNDPLADNTDLYAWRCVDQPDKICIVACWNPGQLPFGGPNYYGFGDNIRYEIHIDNNLATPGDDIIYRYTFKTVNEDPTTFFNIRLGKQNLKQTYTLQKSTDGGVTFTGIKANGYVPPTNIGPRSISGSVGLGAANYDALLRQGITHARTGERLFVGPVDDPFFVDLGGIFDVGDAPRTTGSKPSDGLACKNVSCIAMQIDISELQKDHKSVSQAANILDGDFVVGIWASSSRQAIRTLNGDGTETHSGDWVQVSRLGMPLTNEAVIPIGDKDYWNSLTPYQDLAELDEFGPYFYNPELGLYMDDALFGTAVPALKRLRIQKNSLGAYGFGNGQDGLYSLKGSSAVAGTALDDAIFGTLLLPAAASPRSVDLWPIFNTGVPNLIPYQLATGKNANPLAPGKPFINNFLPNGGDMLRLNMAVPATPRNDPKFSNLGLLWAAVLGLTDPAYNTDTTLQFIPNMDGFPNGRRLEDDATRIELEAVSGIVLAVLGLPYDDYKFDGNLLTPNLTKVLYYGTGVWRNDTAFKPLFPYVQQPWSGVNPRCGAESTNGLGTTEENGFAEPSLNPSALSMASGAASNAITGNEISAPSFMLVATPNPVVNSTDVRYRLTNSSSVSINVYDANGKLVKNLVNTKQNAGTYNVQWNAGNAAKGIYYIHALVNGQLKQTLKVSKQ